MVRKLSRPVNASLPRLVGVLLIVLGIPLTFLGGAFWTTVLRGLSDWVPLQWWVLCTLSLICGIAAIFAGLIRLMRG